MASVLVVDDEAIIREPIAAALRAQGHKVECASEATAANAILSANLPDVMLLDLRMPRQEDGLRLLCDLRVNPATAQLPVFILSNSDDKQLILAAARLGVKGYILKTHFSLTSLIRQIDQISPTEGESVPAAPAPAAAPVEVPAGEQVFGTFEAP